MSATAVQPATLDVSGTRGIPLSRLIRVELRKLVDTRASRWLLIAIAVVTALIIVIFFLTAPVSDRIFLNFVAPPPPRRASCCRCWASCW